MTALAAFAGGVTAGFLIGAGAGALISWAICKRALNRVIDAAGRGDL